MGCSRVCLHITLVIWIQRSARSALFPVLLFGTFWAFLFPSIFDLQLIKYVDVKPTNNRG